MDDIRNVIGSRIRWYRERANESQADLGSSIGVDKNTIYRIEKGRHSAAHETLSAIARHYGITTAELCAAELPAPTSPTVESLTKIIEDQERRIEELQTRRLPDDLLAVISRLDDDQFRDLVSHLRTHLRYATAGLGADDDGAGDCPQPVKKTRNLG